MAYSLRIYSSLLVSLVPLFLFINHSDAGLRPRPRPSMKAKSKLINQICSKAENPSLCLKVLNSNPRSARADPKGLGRISIYMARKHAKQTSDLIASLRKGPKSRYLTDQYNVCAKVYGSAIGDLNGARQILLKKVLSPSDISTFRSRASSAFTRPVTCENAFEEILGPDEPSHEPPKLKQANDKFKGLCSILVEIGASLKS
ncbi:hypothetical protein Vadar_020012 [Vaccinium darrowii]|uniref:Uncharacterized protein n=1 Tax=Vaccinium darrowii TaxID=229202 RepID=A0ACB7XT49_9ERIC|nr:hypothetical protein Vadar_020012 [Vaccinium darrowii]